MVHIYERVEKNEYYPSGLKEIDSNFLFGYYPCVITILAKTWFMSSVNGAIKYVSDLVNPDISEKFKSNRKIYGLGFGDLDMYNSDTSDLAFTEDEPTNRELYDFVTKYLFPLVSEDKWKIDVDIAMKRLKNINFLTYCNGSKIYTTIEAILEEKMRNIGYTNEEIDEILSQMCVAAVGGEAFDDVKATTILFNDKNDTEENDLPLGLSKCKNYYRYVVDGDGKHDYRKYMSQDPVLPGVIKEFLNESLNRAMISSNTGMFIPVDKDKLIPIVIDSFNQKQNSEVQYVTFRFNRNSEFTSYFCDLYKAYKKDNVTVDLITLVDNLRLRPDSDEPFDAEKDAYLELALSGDKVVGFCKHEKWPFSAYEIHSLAVSPQYRNQGIGSTLYNRALANISKAGFEYCDIEVQKKMDDYGFLEKRGAIFHKERVMEIFFLNVVITQYRIPNIREYLDNLPSDTMKHELKQD